MSTIDLTAATSEQTVTENDLVLVDFWAAWCGPCRMFAPVFQKASDENPDVVFAKVDTEAEQALAAMAGITSIPTLMAFREGVLVFAQPGALLRASPRAGHRGRQGSGHGRGSRAGGLQRARSRGRRRRLTTLGWCGSGCECRGTAGRHTHVAAG